MTWLQHWTDVLFLHFRVATDELAAKLPPRLQIDTYDDQAWLSYVFFRLKLRQRGCRSFQLSSLVELNVRTYVRHRGQPGIYFLRMYADNRLAILASRLLTPLCYERATMTDKRAPSGQRQIECRPDALTTGLLSADYCTSTEPVQSTAGSLEAWLLERHRLFVEIPDGRMLAADVEHPCWKASSVHPAAFHHSLGSALGLSLADKPALAHHSPGVVARFHPFRVAAAGLAPSSAVQPAH